MTTYASMFVLDLGEVATLDKALAMYEKHCRKRLKFGLIHPYRGRLADIEIIRKRIWSEITMTSTNNFDTLDNNKEDEPPAL
ncbi:hypothetical protein ACLOAU_04665 [Niabella sp. CJ426]|uniref:hypothetical protein n=1 Tax=Niabella sp. CJ426 TaxID=3393740 RepID=UPI003CFFFD0F